MLKKTAVGQGYLSNGADLTNQAIHLGYRSSTFITLAHYNNDINGTVNTNGINNISNFRFNLNQTPSHLLTIMGLF